MPQPLRFPGRYAGAETELRYDRHRYHSPGEGRFVMQHPIRLDGEVNLAAYAPNNPILRRRQGGTRTTRRAGRGTSSSTTPARTSARIPAPSKAGRATCPSRLAEATPRSGQASHSTPPRRRGPAARKLGTSESALIIEVACCAPDSWRARRVRIRAPDDASWCGAISEVLAEAVGADAGGPPVHGAEYARTGASRSITSTSRPTVGRSAVRSMTEPRAPSRSTNAPSSCSRS